MFRLSRVFAGFTAVSGIGTAVRRWSPYYILYILISVLVLSVLYTPCWWDQAWVFHQGQPEYMHLRGDGGCELKILNAVSLPVPYAQVHSARRIRQKGI